jgi:hypothetical protein
VLKSGEERTDESVSATTVPTVSATIPTTAFYEAISYEGSDNMRTRYALTFYYVVTSLLVVCAAIIVVKLLFFPPCTPAGPNGSVCTVDGWSIAGLAATVLGVAAAILTILGALAVAYWWAELDKRVKAQVTELFNTTLDKKVEDLLDKQKKN